MNSSRKFLRPALTFCAGVLALFLVNPSAFGAQGAQPILYTVPNSTFIENPAGDSKVAVNDTSGSITTLQSAINSARSAHSGSIIVITLLNGATYTVSSAGLTLGSDECLVADGAVIKAANSSVTVPLITISSGAKNVSVAGGTLDGNSASIQAIYAPAAAHVNVDAVAVRNCGLDCILLYGNGNTTYDNEMTVTRCDVSGSTAHAGISIHNCTQAAILDNNCHNNAAGIYLSCAWANVANNTCQNNTTGIDVAGGNDNVVANNTCNNNGTGIHVAGTANMIVSDSTGGNSTAGISSTGSANNFLYNLFNSGNAVNFSSGGTSDNIVAYKAALSGSGQNYFYPPLIDNQHTVTTIVNGMGRTDLTIGSTSIDSVQSQYNTAMANNPNNVIVLHLNGTFTVGATPLTLQSDTCVLLNGKIVINSSTTASAAISCSKVQQISISGGTIDAGNNTGITGISTLDCTMIQIDSMTIVNFGSNATSVPGSDAIKFSNFGGGSPPHLVTRCHVDGSAGRAIWSESPKAKGLYSDNTFNNTRAGIDCDAQTFGAVCMFNTCLTNLYGIWYEQGATHNTSIGNVSQHNTRYQLDAGNNADTVATEYNNYLCNDAEGATGIVSGAVGANTITSFNFFFNNVVLNASIKSTQTGSNNYFSQNYLSGGSLSTAGAETFFNSPDVTGTPDFSLSASPNTLTVVQGNNGTSTITVNPVLGFTGSVSLSASGLPGGVTASFNPSSTTGSSTLTLTASSTATTGTATITVTGTSGSLTHTTTISLTVNPASNFSLSASPGSLTVAQGNNGSSTITVNPVNGFSGSVSLSVSGLPSNTSASFNPSSVAGSGSSTLTVSTTTSTPVGTYTLTITGTSGSLTHSTTVSLTVSAAPNFSLSASPGNVTVTQGANGTSTISVADLNGFTGSVSLSASGLPSGVTASFNPSSTTGSSTLTLTASSTATTGTATVTVTGTSGSLTHTTTISLTVNASTGGSLPAGWTDADIGAVGVAGGASYSSGTFTVNGSGSDIWTAGDQFNYAYQSVSGDQTVIARIVSENGTASYAKAGVMIRETLATNSVEASVLLTLTNGVAMEVRPTTGAASINVAGWIGGITPPQWVKLVRSGNTFTASSSPDGSTWTQIASTNVTMAAGSTAGLAVTSHDNTSLNTATFDNVSITGPSPDFSLSASPGSLTVTQGANGTSTITVNPVNGYTGTVSLSASGLPSGVTASFNPSSTTSSSTLTLTASSTATTGTATVTVTGTSGSLTHTTTISLTVNPASNFSGIYQIQNVASGLVLNQQGSLTNGSKITQWSSVSSDNLRWTFIPTSNGYYQINSVKSGLDAVVQSASTANGAGIIQWSFGAAGNDQWKPVQNSDGTYTFYNLHSGLVLEDPGSSTATSTQMDQWAASGGSNQKWKLIQQ